MKPINVLGIDLAKNVFQLHGEDVNGKVVVRRRLRRGELMRFIANTPVCLIGVEACGGSHWWVRQFKKHGHTVKSMPPQYVKPYVKTNKNDFNDAEAICEAVQRPNMHFVPEKTVAQQDIQSTHRIRSRLISQRTSLCNEIRGLLSEYGVMIPKGVIRLRKELPVVTSEEKNELTISMRQMLDELYLELLALDKRIGFFDDKIKITFNSDLTCKRLSEIEGVGPLAATAFVAAVGDPKVFRNGRQMAAWLGLVPRQNSTGGKTTLQGISKRGDVYLRTLLIHGARSVVRYAEGKTDKRSEWILEKQKNRGTNKAAVAVANKNARIIWKMLMTGESYRAAA